MATTYPGAGDPDGDRRRLALMLARGALDASPVRHWTQGAARLAQALIGGQLMAEDGDRGETASRRTAEALAALASEASGQRGYFRDVRAPDTRPEPSSSARARLLGGGASTSTSESADPAAAAAIVADPRADPSAKQIAAGVLQRALAPPQR